MLSATRHISETELAAYTERFRWRLNRFLSFTQIYPKADSALSRSCYGQALLHKGFLLTTSNQIRRLAQSDSSSIEQFSVLKSYYRQLGEAYTDPSENPDKIAALEEKANALEKEMARTVAGFGQASQQVGWRDVQSRLKPDEVAIEFVHYRFYDPDPTDSTFYAAILVKADSEWPQFIPMFEERKIQSVFDEEEKTSR